MDKKAIGAAIKEGRTALGIELGSTRIKAVLTDEACQVLASDSYGWENELKDGIWTYELKDAWQGIQSCFAGIAAKVREEYDEELKKVGIIGVSAMMHGYLPFDKAGKQLAGFRTWRNNITGEAAEKLTEVANFMLTQLYSAFAPLKIGMDILVKEEGVKTDVMIAQGGLFSTPVIGQQALADMLDMPITVMGTAGEGGPWGMAVLAIYAKCHEANETLADFLDNKVFGGDKGSTLEPDAERVEGCRRFIERYQVGLAAERAASAVDDSDLA